ncbi:helix-turn-helix domain-containing protein [Vibrio sp. CyArs1]|uniref:helix-turn-helix domain-containing protein n=1 Tax=Vibrio sp. CyArs1 TaxID=2682577 RepID=UPI001F06A2B6|nr:helix-turn-helix domain-containing protein [Vibrio sp. CyArs1]
MINLSAYQNEITRYSHKAQQAAKNGLEPYLHKGKSDVFRVFVKQGALCNPSIISRSDEPPQRSNRINHFNEICKWIICNVSLHTRTFASSGNQGQIANAIGVSQSTVSRLLQQLHSMNVIKPAFPAKQDELNKSGVVSDNDGIPLPSVWEVTDDFGYLAGNTAGNKLFKAFRKAEQDADQETGATLKERQLVVRNTLWEGTIERRLKNLNDSGLRKVLSKVTDRFRATQIIFKRMVKRGEVEALPDDQFKREEAIERLIGQRLKYYGFT